jgi:predicted DNA binding CopG/RHH family protein
MSDFQLTEEEQHIEDAAGELVPVSQEERQRLERILARGRKNKNINIRLSEMDLERIKSRADREGLPYQTLISSVLHKYVSDRLIDEDQIVKTLELIGKSDRK